MSQRVSMSMLEKGHPKSAWGRGFPRCADDRTVCSCERSRQGQGRVGSAWEMGGPDARALQLLWRRFSLLL